jgi:hypothetical protein
MVRRALYGDALYSFSLLTLLFLCRVLHCLGERTTVVLGDTAEQDPDGSIDWRVAGGKQPYANGDSGGWRTTALADRDESELSDPVLLIKDDVKWR